MFTIEDNIHCESNGNYESFELALFELRLLADIA